LHGTDGPRGPDAGRRPVEVAEVIDQENLPLGDGLQRRLPGNDASSPESAKPGEVTEHLGGDSAIDPVPSRAQDTPVEVEVRTVPNRGGRRPSVEQYPFGSISVARMVDGSLEGESFFIPDHDHPLRKMAAARKRHRPKTFFSRTDKERGGLWVWRQR
jgi:hypothetical protein